jgi:predicted Zn finger-like uncharacterized protein
MKFNCDRCQTRYSISDDRVRGKILKIRCKSCSAVITVREAPAGAASAAVPDAPAPSAPAPSAAVPDAPAPSAPAPSAVAPASPAPSEARAPVPTAVAPVAAPLPREWFVAREGRQEGPFDLDGARAWIAGQPGGQPLHCWSEGFDAWRPVTEVAELRGAAPANGVSRPPVAPAAAAKVAAPAPSAAPETPGGAAPAEDPSPPLYDDLDPGGSFDLDIGEASRVVDLASLVPPDRAAAARRDEVGSLGPGPESTSRGGPGSPGVELPRPEVLRPRRQRSPVLLPLVAAAGILLVVLVVLLWLALGGEERQEEIARSGVADRGELARQFEETPRSAAGDSGKKEAGQAERGGEAPDTTGPVARPANRQPPRPRRPAAGASSETGPATGEYVAPPGEVDLSGAGRSGDDVKQGTLDPGDVARVYRQKQFSVNRCYENAIKRNPLLKVPKTYVTLHINGGGRVTKVSIPALSGEPLGSCLVASIGRWRFPKSTEGFSGQFPIVFRSR